MKYVTRVQSHSTTYSFAGPKRRINLEVDLYHGSTVSKVMEAKELFNLYLESRDPEKNYKFTGPAHSAMSRLVLPNQYIVIQLQRQYFPPRSRHAVRGDFKPTFPGNYLVGFYLNGNYRSCLLGLVELNAWMTLNQDHLILLTPRREPPKPLPN